MQALWSGQSGGSGMGVRGGWPSGSIREEGREGCLGVSCGPAPSPVPPEAKVPLPLNHSLANEGTLGNGLQGTDAPAHLGCSVELQSHPGSGREDGIEGDDVEASQGREGRKGGKEGRRTGTHLMPLCTTRFLQFLQQEHAWLHSKISGGSILLNSWSSRPSWGRGRGGQWFLCGAPLSCPRLPRLHREIHR